METAKALIEERRWKRTRGHLCKFNKMDTRQPWEGH